MDLNLNRMSGRGDVAYVITVCILETGNLFVNNTVLQLYRE